MLIRKINKSHGDSVLDLMSEGLEYNRKYDPQMYKNVSSKDFKNKINELGHNSLVLVAEIDNMVVGYILGTIKEMKEKTGIINDLVVSQKYRRKGIGKHLVEEMVKYFKNKKCVKVQLNVFEHNKAAIKAYSKYGFQRHVIIMNKDLR